MAQQTTDYDDAFPCPDCGNTRLIQHVTQTEAVEVTENGDFEHISPHGDTTEVQEVWCPECDEKVWERE